jgi:hypothetical protein
MTVFGELMADTVQMVGRLTTHFIIAQRASGIQRAEVLHTDKITSALQYLSGREAPKASNADAMEYLAELMTLVKCEREAVSNFTAMDDEHRAEFVDWCDIAIVGMRVLAWIE